MEERIRDFLSVMTGDKEEQLAISQCLDLETTRAWLNRLHKRMVEQIKAEDELKEEQ